MISRIAHQATALSLAAVCTISILASINMLAVQPSEQGVMAAEKPASQVAQSAQAGVRKSAGG